MAKKIGFGSIKKQDSQVDTAQIEKLIEDSKVKEVAQKYQEFAGDEELNTIIDDAIDEVQNQTNEGFIVSKEDAYEIRKYLVDVKNLQIEAKNTLYNNLIEILKETHFIKKSQSNNNKTTYGLMFAAGVAFGMSDAKWMPFAKGIYEFFTTVLNKG